MTTGDGELDDRALDSIAGEARTVEGGGQPVGEIPLEHDRQESEQPAGASDAESAAMWAMVPQTLGSILAMAMPELRAVYAPEACNTWGRAMVPVAKKYGWNLGGDSPEVALLVATLPFAFGTFSAVMSRRAHARRAAAGGEPGAAPAGAFPSVNETPAGA
jgi:hypothetical protein